MGKLHTLLFAVAGLLVGAFVLPMYNALASDTQPRGDVERNTVLFAEGSSVGIPVHYSIGDYVYVQECDGPITWSVDTTEVAAYDLEEVRAVIGYSLAHVEAHTPLRFVEVSRDAQLPISFKLLGHDRLGETHFDPVNRLLGDQEELYKADSVVLNANYFTSGPYGGPRAHQVTTVLHELGHFLGLAHSDDRSAVMHTRVVRGTYTFTEPELEVLNTLYDHC